MELAEQSPTSSAADVNKLSCAIHPIPKSLQEQLPCSPHDAYRRGEASDRRREPEWTAAVSATARRHGISTSLLFTWRRAYRQSTSQPATGFVPAVVVPDVRPSVPAGTGRIEIVLANRRRVIVDAGVDIVVLSQLVEALERR